jgi:hypothetical protein
MKSISDINPSKSYTFPDTTCEKDFVIQNLHDLFGYTSKHTAKDKNIFTRPHFPFVLQA